MVADARDSALVRKPNALVQIICRPQRTAFAVQFTFPRTNSLSLCTNSLSLCTNPLSLCTTSFRRCSTRFSPALDGFDAARVHFSSAPTRFSSATPDFRRALLRFVAAPVHFARVLDLFHAHRDEMRHQLHFIFCRPGS